jgi:Mn2+/Fe2+ NRAMP family transporter
MLKLINDKTLMGKHTNSHWFNVVAWATTVIVIGLTVVMLWQTLHAVGKS